MAHRVYLIDTKDEYEFCPTATFGKNQNNEKDAHEMVGLHDEGFTIAGQTPNEVKQNVAENRG